MSAIPITPSDLAELLVRYLDRGLFGFDVDGVLSPLVDHADQSVLGPGIDAALTALTAHAHIAVVSGRSLSSLDRVFGFDESIIVIGSHGLEWRGTAPIALDDDETYTLDQLTIIGTKTVEAIGDGAWLEHKPASVVVHTRQADPALIGPALAAATRLAQMIDGAQIKAGHQVVEFLARSTSKGDALHQLADQLNAAPIIYLGDDVTDEEAFKMLGPDDVTVRVGPGATAAHYRLDGPDEVAATLNTLVGLLPTP